MVGNCFTVGVFCVGGALLSLILKQYCSEHSLVLSLAVCSSVFIGAVVMLEYPVSEVRDLFLSAGIPESYISAMFKAFAVCCITHVSAELCRDSGESAMGAAAELWGRAAIVVISLPIVRGLIELIDKLL
jgi:stage III sporulation protein AD